MKRSVILDVAVRAEFHSLLVVSVYLLFSGHNQPGGGFSGGLVAASAFCLLFVADGPEATRSSVRVAPTTILGVGLLLAVGTGLVPLLLGHQFLENAILQADLPVVGDVHTSTVLFFDTGVYLVVLGMVLLLLDKLGGADGSEQEPLPPDGERGTGEEGA